MQQGLIPENSGHLQKQEMCVLHNVYLYLYYDINDIYYLSVDIFLTLLIYLYLLFYGSYNKVHFTFRSLDAASKSFLPPPLHNPSVWILFCIYSPDISPELLRSQLAQYLHLHLNNYIILFLFQNKKETMMSILPRQYSLYWVVTLLAILMLKLAMKKSPLFTSFLLSLLINHQ